MTDTTHMRRGAEVFHSDILAVPSDLAAAGLRLLRLYDGQVAAVDAAGRTIADLSPTVEEAIMATRMWLARQGQPPVGLTLTAKLGDLSSPAPSLEAPAPPGVFLPLPPPVALPAPQPHIPELIRRIGMHGWDLVGTAPGQMVMPFWRTYVRDGDKREIADGELSFWLKELDERASNWAVKARATIAALRTAQDDAHAADLRSTALDYIRRISDVTLQTAVWEEFLAVEQR